MRMEDILRALEELVRRLRELQRGVAKTEDAKPAEASTKNERSESEGDMRARRASNVSGTSSAPPTAITRRRPQHVTWVYDWDPDLTRIQEDASVGDGSSADRGGTGGPFGAEFRLEAPPADITGQQQFRVRARKSHADATAAFTAKLYEGTTLRKTWSQVNLTTSFATYTFDWSDSDVVSKACADIRIRLEFTAFAAPAWVSLDAVDWLARHWATSAGGGSTGGGETPPPSQWPAGWGARPPLGSHFGPGLLLPDSSYSQQKWNEWINFFNGRVPDIVAALGIASTNTWDDIAGGAGSEDTTFSGQLAYYLNYFNTSYWPANKPLSVYLVGAPYSHRNYNPSTGQWRTPSIWAEIKTGTYDIYYRRLWRRLATRCGQTGRDPNTLVIRWCGENTAWWKPDSIGPDKQSFIDGFRRTIDLMRQEVGSVLGQGKTFMVEFGPTMHLNFGQGPTVERLWNVYPGDDWVDVIGMGIHDYKGMAVQQDWDAMLVKNNYLGQWVEGMRDWFDFGASRNKWIGTSEICSNVNTYPPTNPIHPRTQNNHVFWTNGFELLRQRYVGRFLYFCYMFVGGDRNRTDALVTQPWQPDGWGEPIRRLYAL